MARASTQKSTGAAAPPAIAAQTGASKAVGNTPGNPSPANGRALDANGLRQYRIGLAVAARQFRKYPGEALAGGLAGTAEVRLAITTDGQPQVPQLQRSSGNELLDAAALDMIGSAAQTIDVPDSLRGQPFSILLPVEFGSHEE